jgi:RNA-binding protein
MIPELSNSEIRKLKARAQMLKPILRIGKSGLSAEFVKSLNEALSRHELVKVKFADFKERKKELAPLLAETTGCHLITVVGHVAVLYRKKPEALDTV